MPHLFPQAQPIAYAHIAVERSVDRYPNGLTYAIPQELEYVMPGRRVIVPLGSGNTPTPGYVIDRCTQLADLPNAPQDPESIKLILEANEPSSSLPIELIELARWISNYYVTPIGMTLAAMLPAAVKKQAGQQRVMMVDRNESVEIPQRLPKKQAHVMTTLMDLPAEQRPIELRQLKVLCELGTTGPIKRLLDRSLLQATENTRIQATWQRSTQVVAETPTLTTQQQQVISEITPSLSAGFSAHLLHGVTASGKTEVYIRLIETVLAQGRSAILLVPEISLTPQTAGRLISRFPQQDVAILHSQLTAAQRNQQWSQVVSGQARIVIGARSAVFAPMPPEHLGLIIVDEEHDGSYKQDQMPRYNGRDVAIRRAQLADCPVVLGSATPSMESWHNAQRKTYQLHCMPKRVPGMQLPQVHIVDLAQSPKSAGSDGGVAPNLLSPPLVAAIERTLAEGGQTLLLLNRRGYANYIMCAAQQCDWVMQCDHCDVTMVYHRNVPTAKAGYVRCHHCLTQQRLPKACPQCSQRVATLGLGTQRVEEALRKRFPELDNETSMARVDSDTMGRPGAIEMVLDRLGSGELRLLLGTQMIAKGLDYPGVRLVGVINADTALSLPDFRASERTFQLVSQVVGRCGRSTKADSGPSHHIDMSQESGKSPAPTATAIVQTFNPTAPAITLAAQHNYDQFAELELSGRREVGLPPITRMARIVCRDRELAQATMAASNLATALSNLCDGHVRIMGPAPAPIARISGYFREQIELIADDPASLQQVLARARGQGILAANSQVAIDVDPVVLL
ncbi:MAG: primosomal protein N' [Phycisphaerales bacterium]|nr:primosomal protein N' [Phycisphaerales bacterium]